ncbi:TOX high mobility group box family member 3-like isoform X2 [Artemia franciscana]|uniref:TOX high mobility group box family member 3-like isoform X2 n=1 Tax=Artemia franciscana TaxID=6661 RepID=UPI0032DBABF0
MSSLESNQRFHYTPSFGDKQFEISNMYHQQMFSVNTQQGMSAHHQQQQQYEQQRSYAQMSHDNGGYTIQQLGNPMDVNQQHMQSVAQQYELANRGSLEGWTQKTSPPQAALAASPSGESDDSDDSSAQNQNGQKRPSPEAEDPLRGVVAPKKTKAAVGAKKKKKRDPNEPTKPVSAYALFFRDTQAAIKGQNPNASFGEVSKIVASMWDALDAEHKNVYKKKTEAAKKDYLKQLAAYRATLVSKGNEHEQQPQQQQSFNRPGPGYAQFPQYGQYGPPSHSPPGMSHVQRQQMMAHQAAMNRHIMTGQTMNNQMVNTGQPMGNPGNQGSPMSNPGQPMHGGPQHIGMMQQHMGGQQVGQGMVPSPGQQGQMMGHNSPVQVPNRSPNSSKMQEQQQNQQQHNQAMAAMQQQSHQQQQYMQHQQAIANHQQMSMQQSAVSSNSTGQNGHQHAHPHGPDGHPTRCIRAGCVNPAVFSPEWDDEYCSNECVVSHCRDVFNAWVASNQAQGGNSYPAPVK